MHSSRSPDSRFKLASEHRDQQAGFLRMLFLQIGREIIFGAALMAASDASGSSLVKPLLKSFGLHDTISDQIMFRQSFKNWTLIGVM